jgi:AmiR/NasT family two-component response regulator
MYGPKISLVFAKEETHRLLEHALNSAGYSVFNAYTSGTEALRNLRLSPPDIAIVDYSLADFNGLRLCRILCEENICACVLASPPAEKMRCISELGLCSAEVLSKPLKRDELFIALEILKKNVDRIQKLEKEVQRLRDEAKSRIFVDIAKGLIMKQGVDEQTAYTAMRKASMDLRTPIKEIALKIIDGRLKWAEIEPQK